MIRPLAKSVTLASTPYGLRPYQGRFFLTINGVNQHGQYGSMDRETALRVYRAYRDAWLRAECAA